MIPKEILKKIRHIEIKTNRLVTDVFAGQYHSVFKGQGIEFDEVREYQIGDDIRTIDWNVTARTNKPHVKKFIEERELTVMILVDASQSCYFGSTKMLKSQLATEIAAVLAFSAIKNNDNVGLIIFTDKIELFIPPRKGIKHVLRVIREVLYHKPTGHKTDILQATEYLNKVTTRKTITFLISDFISTAEPAAFKQALSIVNKRHDFVAVTLNDPRDAEFPNCGVVQLHDPETGKVFAVDTSSKRIREHYTAINQRRIDERKKMFTSIGLDHINVSTETPYTEALIRFFTKRRKRIR